MRDYETEEALQKELERRRRARRAEARRRRRRRERRKRILILCGLCLAAILLIGLAVKGISLAVGKLMSSRENQSTESQLGVVTGTPADILFRQSVQQLEAAAVVTPVLAEGEEAAPFDTGYTMEATEATVEVDSESVTSTYALLVDLDEQTIVAQRNARDRINPASMTKILTLLVAVEHVTDLDDTFTITREITDYSYSNDCSAVGFDDGETVTIRDLMYGTILPSGGDAALALAMYVSGSQEDFVELMNQKVEELGLAATTHFTNCVGLYDENHYTTPYDMAILMKAVLEREVCREILSARTYTTSSTEQHPDGIQVSNWFLRRIEDKDTGGEVLGAKTGYVTESGNCAVSYEVTESGKHYICVTADAHSSWRCIYDHVAMYQNYAE